ncbi:MAG: UPF0280 family protein [Candidatus Thorarchaeota archaeon]
MQIYKFHFIEKQSNITIISESKHIILRAKKEFYYQRQLLEDYISHHKEFLTSFSPVRVQTEYEVVNLMAQGAFLCDVGPMATVAGAFADIMLKIMKSYISEFNIAKIALIENGGEVANDSEKTMKVALFAGNNQLSIKIGFLLKKEDSPIGIATSSATIGHAISLGEADAVTIFANTTTIADGASTRVCNLVKGLDIEKSIKRALDTVDDMEGVKGAFISRQNMVGLTGKIPEIFRLNEENGLELKKKLEYQFPENFEIIK